MKATVLCFSLLLAACSINHKSEQYACKSTADCDTGRVCSDGFCVLAGTQVDASRVDGPRGDSGGGGCPSGCSSCNTTLKTCTIDCTKVSCQNSISCPAGYKCDIACNVDGACRNGVSCQAAASCSIECTAKGSCENVQCGSGPCSINCAGTNACKNVSCGNSCACDILCSGSMSCSSGIQCTSFACRAGLGCTSVPALCHSCQ